MALVALGLEVRPQEWNVWPGVCRFTMRMNPGGPFSLFHGHTWWLIGVSVAAIGVILYLYLSIVRRGEIRGVLSLALIAGGDATLST